MRRSGLLWTLFAPLLVIIVASLVLADGLAARSVRLHLQERTRRELQSAAELTAPRFAPLVAASDLDAVQILCDEAAAASGDRFTVVRADGEVLGDSSEDPSVMDNHGDRPELREAFAGRVGSSRRYSSTTSADRIYVAVPGTAGSGTVFAVRASRSLDDIDLLLRDVLGRIGLAGLLLALVAGAATFVLARSLRNTLVELGHQADALAGGDLEAPTPLTGPIELVNLAEALDRMRGRLRHHIAAIEGQRQELEAVMESMVEGILAVDTEENVIRSNRAATDLLGLDPQRTLGRSIQEVGRHPVITRLAQDALAEGLTADDDIRTGPGDATCLQVTATDLVDGAGDRMGALLVFNDVTRLRRLETMRRDFVANVSHELKTPITSIKGFVETLLDSPPEDREEGRRFLDIIGRQSDRLDAIISDLLALSRLEEHTDDGGIERHDLPLAPVLERIVRDLAARNPDEAARIELACAKDLRAFINPALLEQAVGNLLDNALKYSPENSSIRVGCLEDGDQVLVTVADSGPGIAAEHLPRLFERFYRVDKARSRRMGGTGLGLAIVKHIAQAHRGSIAVESEVGHGTTFTIRLPREETA